ncbi:hypothetical protein HBH68_225780 [Parastagonospora nodorum]|nr:hypothetical protein HBH96_240080 [Parastagonospora nodorum]KAH5168792.1 hypothetical protein HBH68_225780 [Parastagonospora nodorum]KAH5179203.1 hypothetical protein HBH76_182350 [Parastagonospora nodorum]
MGTSEQGPSKSPHTSPAGANRRGLNDVHVDADANAADSSQDGTYVDDDALASSRPPRIHLRECDDDDELQRGRLSFRRTLHDRTVDPIEWLEDLPFEEGGSSRESPRYSRPTMVRVPQPRSMSMVAWALGRHFVEFARKSYGELRDYAAQTFIGDERHPLPEPKREKRCASEPILCRRATDTSEDELQESSTADKQVQLTGAESMEKEKAEWTSDGEIGAETPADGVVA